jgi:hypothetical protein
VLAPQGDSAGEPPAAGSGPHAQHPLGPVNCLEPGQPELLDDDCAHGTDATPRGPDHPTISSVAGGWRANGGLHEVRIESACSGA